MKTLSRRASRLAVPAFVLLGLLTGAAQGGVGGWGHGTLGDDDIGSLPSLANPDAPSLILVGDLADLSAVLLDVQGPGDLHLRSVSPGSHRWLLELEGTLSVALDAHLLASGRVETLFGVGSTFADATASAYSDGTWTPKVTLPGFVVGGLPLSALTDGASVFALQANALTGESFTLWSRSSGGVLHVGQILRSVD